MEMNMRSKFMATLVIVCSILSDFAWGQQGGDGAGGKATWVLSYALVVLCIGLSVYIISKPARREK